MFNAINTIRNKEEAEEGFAKLEKDKSEKFFHQGRASAFAESRKIIRNQEKKFFKPKRFF